jgi:hypothetical protein
MEAFHLQRTRFEMIAGRKLRRRQLTEDGNVEITGRDLSERTSPLGQRSLFGTDSTTALARRTSLHRHADRVPKYRDAAGMMRPADSPPGEMRAPIGDAVLDALVERGLAERRFAVPEPLSWTYLDGGRTNEKATNDGATLDLIVYAPGIEPPAVPS